ncbi:MAG: aldo/keto reductase [Candidatus Margulisiibacteriota bacterium]
MSKLALGTAQFGLDYGINNERGKVPDREVTAILDFAAASGITTLDTAAAYGDSEERLGRYLAGGGRRFQLISKLQKNAADPARALAASLARLQAGALYGFLLHDFKTYENDPSVWEKLQALRTEGKVGKIGFSLYYPAELEKLLTAGLRIDLVQLPYNLFDRRFARYFDRLKKAGVEVHVRSLFLQGLFFRPVAALSAHFNGVKGKLTALRDLAARHKLSLLELALGFALANGAVDKAVVGVDSLANLQEIVAAERTASKAGKLPELADLQEDDEAIILPFNWTKEKSDAR